MATKNARRTSKNLIQEELDMLDAFVVRRTREIQRDCDELCADFCHEVTELHSRIDRLWSFLILCVLGLGLSVFMLAVACGGN